MLKVFILFYLFTLFHFSFADDKSENHKLKIPPLSVVIQLEPDRSAFVSNSKQYIESFDESFLNSILSLPEVWSLLKEDASKQESYRYIQLFYRWYFTELPLVILARKRSAQNNNTPTELDFLFRSDQPFTADKLIALANRYNYNFYEKLNLFLVALYKNISEEELLKVLEAWNIKNNIGFYIHDYKDYVDVFLDKFKDNKDEIRFLFEKLKHPVTSILHELIEASKVILFYKMMQNPELRVNIRNYLAQTAFHIAANMESIKSHFYVFSFFKHPKTNFNLQDFKGWTPIFYTVSQSEDDSFSSVRQFLDHKHKLDLKVLDYKRRPLPLLAAEFGMPDLAEFLHKNGAPLPEKVSLFNSYMTKDYKALWFKYDLDFNLDRLAHLFDLDKDTPSFREFQQINIQELPVERETIWENFKYYLLFKMLRNKLFEEENARFSEIMPLLFDDEGDNKPRDLKKIIRAIYRGDISEINKIFSENPEAIHFLNKSLFSNQHFFQNYWDKKTILDFNILNRMDIYSSSQSDRSFSFYTDISSFLSEAIRANQAEMVLYLLQKGANPTFDEKSFVVKNSIVTAMLMGNLLYTHEEPYKDHLRIVDILMNHPLITKDFLNNEVIPGINYADFAALMGHFYILKKMYKKGASVSNKNLWGTKLSIETYSITSGLMRQTEFILKQKLKKNPKNEKLKKHLNICQKAFH